MEQVRLQLHFGKDEQKIMWLESLLLKLVGRATLVQSTISTIRKYYMQSMKLPTFILNNIDRINRNFSLGSTKLKNFHIKYIYIGKKV